MENNESKVRLEKEILAQGEVERPESVETLTKANEYICLKHIDKVYDNKVQAVFDFNLDVHKHEFIVFVGPSGCGKSTTLRMIAGLEEITAGELTIDGQRANDLAPKDRDISMVFQSYALYPHMSVADNIGFGLKMRHVAKSEIKERTAKVAATLQIEDLLDRKPKALSGGQRQRVALGRAIVRNAKVFLMDEPLSNLDAKLRVTMRSEIIKLHNQLKATTIYVTHDQTEAMTMASRIVVMQKGYIQQIGTPSEIYNRPNNIFVATFIGSPAMNMIKATYTKGLVSFEGSSFTIKFNKEQASIHDSFYKRRILELGDELRTFKTDEDVKALNKARGGLKYEEEALIITNNEIREQKEKLLAAYQEYLAAGSYPVIVGIRPEDIHEDDNANTDYLRSESFAMNVVVPELLGSEYYIHGNFADKEITAKIPAKKIVSINDKISFHFNLEKIQIFDELSEDSIRK